jgi:hypothetical protein
MLSAEAEHLRPEHAIALVQFFAEFIYILKQLNLPNPHHMLWLIRLRLISIANEISGKIGLEHLRNLSCSSKKSAYRGEALYASAWITACVGRLCLAHQTNTE